MALQLSSQGTGSRRGTACGPLWPQKLDFTQPTTQRSSRTRSLAASAHRLARSRVPTLDLDPSRRTQRWNHRTSKIPRATPFIPTPEPPPRAGTLGTSSFGLVPALGMASLGLQPLARVASAGLALPMPIRLHRPTFPASEAFDPRLSPCAARLRPSAPPACRADLHCCRCLRGDAG